MSNWSNSLLDYSMDLITYGDVFVLEGEDNTLKLVENVDELRKSWIKNDNPLRHVFWLSFCVGVECLCKAVLIEHKSLPIKKRNVLSKYSTKTHFDNYQELKQYREKKKKDIHHSVYRTGKNHVKASNNEWLQNQFDKNDIEYSIEINSRTLGFIYNHGFEKLYEKEIIDEDEKVSLEKGIQTLTDIRRNVDAHIYLKSRTVGSINKDIEKIYLPNINLLLNIFKRTS